MGPQSIEIDALDLGSPRPYWQQCRNAELGRLLHQPIQGRPLDWRKHQPQVRVSFRLGFAQLAFYRERGALTDFGNTTEPFPIGGVEDRDRRPRAETQHRPQIVGLRPIQLDFGARDESGRNVETGDAALDHSAVSNCFVFTAKLASARAKMISRSSNSGGAASRPGPLPVPSLTLPRKRGREGWGQSEERDGPAQRESEGELAARSDSSDIHQNDWVVRRLPARLQPYARLARLDRPTGPCLLLAPGWAGISLASQRCPHPLLLVLFPVGAVAMRGAGCPLEHISARDYDGQSARARLCAWP